ncbi:ABC transporter ATP-binding protein [Euzebya sp.]|uniref:ABC transporter ATP-binding protein n=1 Tax=Euzebya sp. TaxID=1971409 RepID=UPI0035155127
MSRVELTHISKAFDDVEALRDISLDIEDGSFFVLLGPSGAGKTTTLRVIAGLERPDGGEVRFDGMSAGAATPAERDVAMVFQSYALYPKQTVAENIASPLRARRIPADDADARVREVADLLHIGHLLARSPGQLSGGEQQRVALGRALVREPRAFLMDEPLTNLDVKLRVEMRAELMRLHRHVGRTFIYVSNDQAEAMSMADRIAVLHQGEIQQVGTPDEIYDQPVNRFVATFVGSSRMNLLSCRLDGAELVGEGWRLPAPAQARGAEGPLQLGVRPEDLVVDRSRPGLPPVRGVVYAVEPLGDRVLVDVEVGDTVIRVKAPPEVTHAIGDPVDVGVDIDRVHVFDQASGRSLATGDGVDDEVGPEPATVPRDAYAAEA